MWSTWILSQAVLEYVITKTWPTKKIKRGRWEVGTQTLLRVLANNVLYWKVTPPSQTGLLKIIIAFLYRSTSILFRSLYHSNFFFGKIFHLLLITFDISTKPIFPRVFRCFLVLWSSWIFGRHCSISNFFDTCLSKSSSTLSDDCDARRDITSLMRFCLSFPCKPSSEMTLIIFSLSTLKKKLSENKRESL